jgi:serine/threonine protein kinase
VYFGYYKGFQGPPLPVAVKTLRDGFTEEQLISFFDETDIISAIPTHEHVIGFLGATADPILIVTEFATEGSLFRFLRKLAKAGRFLTSEQVRKMNRDIADGMAHLHRHNVVHRDLAARNVLLTTGLVPKIADFGMSRHLADSQEHQSNTTTMPVRWMSIEAIKHGTFSEASDVWAWAITAYEVASMGAVPYGTEQTTIAITREVLTGMRLQYPSSVGAEDAHLYGTAMGEAPEDRPTFEEIVHTLDTSGDPDHPYASLSSFKSQVHFVGQTGGVSRDEATAVGPSPGQARRTDNNANAVRVHEVSTAREPEDTEPATHPASSRAAADADRKSSSRSSSSSSDEERSPSSSSYESSSYHSSGEETGFFSFKPE